MRHALKNRVGTAYSRRTGARSRGAAGLPSVESALAGGKDGVARMLGNTIALVMLEGAGDAMDPSSSALLANAPTAVAAGS